MNYNEFIRKKLQPSDVFSFPARLLKFPNKSFLTTIYLFITFDSPQQRREYIAYTVCWHYSTVIQTIGTPYIEEAGIEACIRTGRQGYNYMPQVRTSKMPPC